MPAADGGWLSEAEYLERERASETKHEYHDGEVVAMAGASVEHNLVCGNAIGALRERLRDKPCVVLTSDQRVWIEATRRHTYPDVSVVCGPIRRHATASDTITNPLVIVEVLSPSTEAYDRGAKFAHYRRLPSLVEYVLVATEERRVETFRRNEKGQWLLAETAEEGAQVEIEAIGAKIPLSEIYAKLDQLAEPAT